MATANCELSAVKTTAPPLQTVFIPFPGRTIEWTRLISEAFATGVDAVVTVADDALPTPESLEVITRTFASHRDTILGGRLIDAKQRYHVVHAGWFWSESDLQWRRESYMEVVPDPGAPATSPVRWVTSAAIVIPRRVWEATGGFDPRFGDFLADVDFCLRAQLSGFSCLQVRDALLQTTRAPSSFDVTSDLERIRSTLLLASRHGLPRGLAAMTLCYLIAHLRDELDRVDFWADYGSRIGLARRTLWFLRHCLEALRRERLRLAVREILCCAWTFGVRRQSLEAS
jgi:GT2 family glycosyltransferase